MVTIILTRGRNYVFKNSQNNYKIQFELSVMHFVTFYTVQDFKSMVTS